MAQTVTVHLAVAAVRKTHQKKTKRRRARLLPRRNRPLHPLTIARLQIQILVITKSDLIWISVKQKAYKVNM